MKNTLLAIIAICYAIHATGQTDKPYRTEAAFNEQEWDFGNVPRFEFIYHKFYLINTGTQPVIITGAVHGGSIGPSDYSKEPIQPGDSGRVGFSFKADNLGTFTKTINVTTTAGNYILVVKGYVYKVDSTDFGFDKTVHDFGTIPKTPQIKCTFTIFNTGKYPLKINRVNSSSGNLIFRWPTQPIPVGASAEIEGTMLPNLGSFYKIGSVYIAGYPMPQILALKGVITEPINPPSASPPSQK